MAQCIFVLLNNLAGSYGVRFMSHEVQETDEEFDARYVAFFSRPDIDGWEIRKVRTLSDAGRQLAEIHFHCDYLRV